MKKQQLLLTNPCTENWDDMQPSKTGRYCDACSKHIVDLTEKSDAELISFFNKKKDNVCGRLLATQLHRDLTTPPKKSNWNWLLPVALGTTVFTPAKALELKSSTVQNDNLQSFEVSRIPTSDIQVREDYILIGKVLDEQTGKPLANVKIKRKGFNNVIALTDSTGIFKLSVATAEKTTVLIFELNGFISVEKTAADKMLVKMSERRIVVGGVSTIATSGEPLYIIKSGKKSCEADLKQINPNWIKKIDILKDASATALYGSKAANGVVIVEIKKQYAYKVDFSKKN